MILERKGRLETGLWLFKFLVSRSLFFNNGLTTGEQYTKGKASGQKWVVITEGRRRSSMSWASRQDGSGSSSQVLTAVLFNTSLTVASDSGWNAVSGDPTKTPWLMAEIGRVRQLRLSRMVEIFFTKKSQNLWRRGEDAVEDGRSQVSGLPSSVFVMLYKLFGCGAC